MSALLSIFQSKTLLPIAVGSIAVVAGLTQPATAATFTVPFEWVVDFGGPTSVSSSSRARGTDDGSLVRDSDRTNFDQTIIFRFLHNVPDNAVALDPIPNQIQFELFEELSCDLRVFLEGPGGQARCEAVSSLFGRYPPQATTSDLRSTQHNSQVISVGNLDTLRWNGRINTSASASAFRQDSLARATLTLDGQFLPSEAQSGFITYESVPIPTPALLPGLIGMGIAALRKNREEQN